jgi:hypothetical protein
MRDDDRGQSGHPGEAGGPGRSGGAGGPGGRGGAGGKGRPEGGGGRGGSGGSGGAGSPGKEWAIRMKGTHLTFGERLVDFCGSVAAISLIVVYVANGGHW